jgi:hypothetical protein
MQIVKPTLAGSIAGADAAQTAIQPPDPARLRAHYRALLARLKISPLVAVGKFACGKSGEPVFVPAGLEEIESEIGFQVRGIFRKKTVAWELHYFPGRFVVLNRYGANGAQLFNKSWNWMAGSAEVIAAELEADVTRLLRKLQRWAVRR